MRELALRLTALDPSAGQTLQVVAYFDALVARQASVQALVRGAAALAGCPAGYAVAGEGTCTRAASDGAHLPPTPPAGHHIARAADAGAVVWLERERLDETASMVLERLAMAVGIARARAATARTPRSAVAVLLDATAPSDERARALTRLGLDATEAVRVAATMAGLADSQLSHRSTLLPTAQGVVRAEVVAPERLPTRAGGRSGIGVVVPASEAPRSYDTAMVALRLTTGRRPVVDAEELGALLTLALADHPSLPVHPDVAALQALLTSGVDLETLDAVQDTTGLRAAAAVLGLHHSTVQARVRRARAVLGYDPASPEGRLRYGAARLLHRLREGPAVDRVLRPDRC